MPRHIGLASGALMTGFGGGSVFYNELITFYINPKNLKPDVTGSRTTYFSQPEVLDRVPELFLLLGGITVILQLIGLSLLRSPVEGDEIEVLELQEVKPIIETPVKTYDGEMHGSKTGIDNPAILDIDRASTADTVLLKDISLVDENIDKTPLEVLKTADFYILGLFLAFNHYGYIIKNNYYKEFGQIHIDNDHFLTTTGTIATIGVSLARLLWGMATDWLGTKLTLMVFTTLTAVIASLYYFSLLHSPGLYMFAVIMISVAFTGAFILIPLAALKCFGEKHYAYNYGLILSSQWMPRHIGLASGALMTGFGGGSVFYNELITFYINPKNLKPDVTGSRTTYFSQPEVLDRVPELFLLLGGITVILQLIGLSLLRSPVEGDEIEVLELQEVKPIIETPVKTYDGEMHGSKTGIDNPAILDIDRASTADTVLLKDISLVDENIDKTPLEVLKTADFYILWFVLAFNHYGHIIKNNYYKEFGQIHIDNDHFLTTTGTIATIGVSLARLLWGMATDWLGTKLTLMVFTTLTAVIASLYYFSLLHSPGLYMFAVIMISVAFTGAFILIPLAALKCFGEKHYAYNYGLILSSQTFFEYLAEQTNATEF